MSDSLPNEWSPDSANEELVNDIPVFGMKGTVVSEFRSPLMTNKTTVATRKLIEEIGKSSYIPSCPAFGTSIALPKFRTMALISGVGL